MSVAAGPSLRPHAALLHQHLTTATAMFREMGMAYWLKRAETEMRESA